MSSVAGSPSEGRQDARASRPAAQPAPRLRDQWRLLLGLLVAMAVALYSALVVVEYLVAPVVWTVVMWVSLAACVGLLVSIAVRVHWRPLRLAGLGGAVLAMLVALLLGVALLGMSGLDLGSSHTFVGGAQQAEAYGFTLLELPGESRKGVQVWDFGQLTPPERAMGIAYGGLDIREDAGTGPVSREEARAAVELEGEAGTPPPVLTWSQATVQGQPALLLSYSVSYPETIHACTVLFVTLDGTRVQMTECRDTSVSSPPDQGQMVEELVTKAQTLAPVVPV